MGASGLVVRSMATMPRSRSGSTRAPRASTIEACDRPASSLCTLITAASASAARASGRQRRREAQVSPPGLVDDERQAGGVRGGGQPRHVGAEAVVARRGDEDGAGPRVLFDRGREALERHVHGHLPSGVEGGLDVDGHGAREDQAGQQRLVGVARHDDLVAGTGDRHDQRLQAAARAVAHEEGVIGAPGERRQRLGARQQTARLLGVVEAVGDAHVGRQQTLAKRVDQVGRRAGAELVAGRVEGRHAPLTVGAQRLDERRLALIGLRHAALAGL